MNRVATAALLPLLLVAPVTDGSRSDPERTASVVDTAAVKSVRTISVVVDASSTNGPSTLPSRICSQVRANAQRLLEAAGFSVVTDPGAPVDGAFRITLWGEAIGRAYQGAGGARSGYYYTGARVTGSISFSCGRCAHSGSDTRRRERCSRGIRRGSPRKNRLTFSAAVARHHSPP